MSEPEREVVSVGKVNRLSVYEPGEKADGPVLVAVGTQGLAAIEFADIAFIDGLEDVADEMRLIHSEENE